ncbi:pro-FMRFamide-related neuropeptide VF [Moschus berezovskii]|uniref:pro-FMRFamide-related neuropeptide VF n=1 Tax=Moschus berezovskii TaxID=68408 RepID=UPI002444FB00|nr:pro-FMRFamide-related neuropeptide VF [Moschus berezovskii]
MEIILLRRFILLMLTTSSLLTSNIFCTDESRMPNLYSKKNYDEYSEPRGDPGWDKERSLTFEEVKDWGPKIKMNTPAVNKMPPSAANLPLRFGRNMEERSTRVMAHLPLRLGKNREDSLSRRVPNLPQRFGRMTTAKTITKSLSNLLQQSMRSPSTNGLLYSMTCQAQEIQNPDQKNLRRLGFQKTDDAELKQEK